MKIFGILQTESMRKNNEMDAETEEGRFENPVHCMSPQQFTDCGYFHFGDKLMPRTGQSMVLLRFSG